MQEKEVYETDENDARDVNQPLEEGKHYSSSGEDDDGLIRSPGMGWKIHDVLEVSKRGKNQSIIEHRGKKDLNLKTSTSEDEYVPNAEYLPNEDEKLANQIGRFIKAWQELKISLQSKMGPTPFLDIHMKELHTLSQQLRYVQNIESSGSGEVLKQCGIE